MKIVKVHHADHGVPFSTLEWALERIAPTAGFFAVTVDLPDGHAPLLSALYGPLAGDPPVEDEDVVYVQRTPDRPLSRMVRRPPRPTHRLTVIGIVTGEGDDKGAVLFTAYGGELAEREPGDGSLVPGSPEHARAAAFWAVHALALVEPPVEPSTESAE